VKGIQLSPCFSDLWHPLCPTNQHIVSSNPFMQIIPFIEIHDQVQRIPPASKAVG
jgi:hypothetical protein